LSTQGKVIAHGSDITVIRSQLKKDNPTPAAAPAKLEQQFAADSLYGHPLEQQGLTDWTFGDLPAHVQLDSDLKLLRYPCLRDLGDSVAIVLETEADRALETTKFGLVRLYQQRSVQQRNHIRKLINHFEKSQALKLSVFQGDWSDDLITAIYLEAFNVNELIPRTKREFDESLSAGKSRLLGVADNYVQLLQKTLDDCYVIRQRLAEITSPQLTYVREDTDQQLANLMQQGFLRNTGFLWLNEYPRYFKAIKFRLDKIPQLGVKDRINTQTLTQFWTKFVKYTGQTKSLDARDRAELLHFRWMIEELRVSLFAQHLKTRIPVSEQRLNKHWDKLNNRPAVG